MEGFRIAALGGAVFFCFASGSPSGGERTGGECPAGETCSPDTPDGLYFGGSILGDDVIPAVGAPVRIAVGGTETLSIFRDANGSDEFVGFQALAAGPSFQVLAVASNKVSVKGLATGTDFLRLVDPQTQELYDRKQLETAPVDHLAVIPPRVDLLGDEQLYSDPEPHVVYAASRVSGSFVVALYDSSDVRLADESMTLQLGNPFGRDTSQWDRFRAPQTLAVGASSIGVTLGDASTATLDITVVDGADAVVWVPGHGATEKVNPSSGVALGVTGRFCFRATNGGRPVVGETYSYVATGGLQVTSAPGPCVDVQGTAIGPASLQVSAGAGVLSVDIPVRASAQAKRSAPPDDDPTLEGTPLPAATGPAPGERAGS